MSRAKDKRVRYAVVGAGNIAQAAILPAFRNVAENSELVALVSGKREKREALAKRYRLRFTADYDQLEQVIDDAGVDAVYITVPNTLHRTFTERAATKGVHVLCEKPLAVSVEDCEAMIRACEQHGVRLMTAYRLHFEEANLRAVELVKAGTIGQPRLFSGMFTQEVRAGDVRTKHALGGGALFDMGIYCINAARYVFRDEPEDVMAMTTRGDDRFEPGVDASTTAILRFPGGRLAQLSCSLGAASVSSFHVIGTKGDLRVEPAFGYTQPLEHFLTVAGKTSHQKFKVRDQFGPEILHFSRAILENTQPGPSGAEGLADVRIACALRESIEQNRPVHLLPFMRVRRPSLQHLITMPAIGSPKPVNAPAPAKG